jgi:hypothetical protein
MSQDGNPVRPRHEETLSLPLSEREIALPAQYEPATPEIPAETVQGRLLEPLQPAQYEPAHHLLAAERVELPAGVTLPERREEGELLSPLLPAERRRALPLETARTPETVRRRDAVREPDDATQPRFYKSTKPDAAFRLREDDEDPETRPRLLDREAAKQPTGDGGDDPPPQGENPPPQGENPPTRNPPSTTSRGNAHGSVYVDTDKLSQAIPGLDRIMGQMYSIGNNTANALAGYQLDRGDSYGEAWTRTADPIATQILEGLANAGSVFGDTAEGAHLMVHNYNITEENAVNSAGDLSVREK